VNKHQKNSFLSWVQRHKLLSSILGILAVLVIVLLVMAFVPFRVKDVPGPNPSASYEDALSRLNLITDDQAANPELNPVCYTRALTHGEKTENVIVLFHGFTSCPEQMAILGEQLFDHGYNVLIPLQPHHGELDRINNTTNQISSKELSAFAMQSVDIARGLGDNVTVAGISGGGALSVWLAQTRDDIQTAMPIAPFLGIHFIPTPLNRPVANLLDNIPNIPQWWDPVKKENNPYTGEYQYPRYGTHGLAEYLRLGFAAERDAKEEAPAAKIIMVSNASDLSVSNGIIDQFIQLWEAHEVSGDGEIESFRFDKSLNLPHDVITPERYEGNLTIVYPKLLELLGIQ
jgi:carboxylesterase